MEMKEMSREKKIFFTRKALQYVNVNLLRKKKVIKNGDVFKRDSYLCESSVSASDG